MKLELSTTWNGTTTIGTRQYPNHDSLHSGDDVLALVRKICEFDGFRGPDKGGFQAVVPKELKKGPLGRLATAARGDTTMITVAKGIHQRQTNPHIRITLGTEVDTFHVELAEDILKSGRDAEFQWKVVGITVVKPVAKEIASWPRNYERVLSPGGQNSVRMRRNSTVGI